jgi:flagellar basal-body rod protein FlgG
MTAQQLQVEVIANNLANMSTVGFKKSSGEFQDLFYQTFKAPGSVTESGTLPVGIQIGSGVRPVAVHRRFGQGELQQTDNPLDLAIQGEGFFQVTMPDGETGYTRAGSIKTDADGRLVNPDGYPLLPNITIPANTESVTISSGGEISVVQSGSATPTQVGVLELARFTNPAGLSSQGQNLFELTEASGDAVTGAPGQDGMGTILQGAIESSNVNIAEEMVNMIIAQRAYEINSKAIQTTDEMLGMVNNLKR